MKTNKFLFAALAITVFASCESQKLPYDLEGTQHSVVINISKAPGTSTTLATDKSGDYKVVLSAAPQQGDISMFKEAQIMAIYTDGAKNKTAAIIKEGITSLPATVTIDISDACTKLGVSTIAIGDRIELTPCHTLQNGTQVNGWSELGGFNNQAFTGWTMENGAKFAYRVAYTAFAPFHKEKFQGNAVPWDSDFGETGTVKVTQITELPEDPSWIPAGVADTDLVGLKLEGDLFWGPGVMGTSLGETVYMWINTQDYTLIIPDQVMCPTFAYPGLGEAGMVGYLEDGEGEVDTLHDSLSFYFVPTFGAGYWFGGGFEIELYF